MVGAVGDLPFVEHSVLAVGAVDAPRAVTYAELDEQLTYTSHVK